MSCADTLAALCGSSTPKIYCECHEADEIQRYCRTCDMFVCLECIVGEHKGHSLLRINEFAESKKDDIVALVDRVKGSHLTELQQRIQHNREARKVTRQCVSECIKHMNNRFRDIRNYMEKVKTEMVLEIKEAQKYEFERLDDIEKYLLSEENDLKILVKLCEKAIANNKATDMIMIGLVLEFTVLNLEQCPPAKIEEIEFCAKMPLESTMDDLFGYFRERKIIVEADEQLPTDLMVEKRIEPLISFQQAEDSLGCIIPMNDGMVWISLTGESVVYLVKHGNIRKKEELDGIIADIDITKDDHLIVAMKGRHRLLRIKPNGQKLDFIDLKPLYPNGVHITNSGDTYVSAIDKDTTEVGNDSKNCVIKYTNTGTGLQRYVKDQKGTRFFNLPRKLITTSDKDVCVIDALSIFSGRVVSVSPSGDINFVYYGREDLDMVTFNPIAIKCNSRDHIIVADFDNCFLHILNKDGQLLFLMTCNQPECIYGPSALGIDQSDSIWIGTYDGNVTKMTPYARPKHKEGHGDIRKTNSANMTIGDLKRLKSPYQKPNGSLDTRASPSNNRLKSAVSRERSIIKPQVQEKKPGEKIEGKEKSFTRQQSSNAMKGRVKSAMKRRPTMTRMATNLTKERTIIADSIQENDNSVKTGDENKNVKESSNSNDKNAEENNSKVDTNKDTNANESAKQENAEPKTKPANKKDQETNPGNVEEQKNEEQVKTAETGSNLKNEEPKNTKAEDSKNSEVKSTEKNEESKSITISIHEPDESAKNNEEPPGKTTEKDGDQKVPVQATEESTPTGKVKKANDEPKKQKPDTKSNEKSKGVKTNTIPKDVGKLSEPKKDIKGADDKKKETHKQPPSENQYPKRKRHQCEINSPNPGPKGADVKKTKDAGQKPKGDATKEKAETKNTPIKSDVSKNDEKKDESGEKNEGEILQTATKHVRK